MPDQTSADTLPVVGTLTLTAGDNFAFLFSRLPRLVTVACIASAVTATLVWLLTMSAKKSALLRQDPIFGVKNFTIEVIPWILAYAVLFVGVICLCSWLGFLRTPLDNRQLTYQADGEALRTSDAAGAILTLPWSLTRQTRITKHLLLMELKTRVWRYVPLRAFSAADRSRLIALAQRTANTRP
jgi:hypothetical protein